MGSHHERYVDMTNTTIAEPILDAAAAFGRPATHHPEHGRTIFDWPTLDDGSWVRLYVEDPETTVSVYHMDGHGAVLSYAEFSNANPAAVATYIHVLLGSAS